MKKRFNVVAATDLKRPGSNERLVGANGELNAGSNKELLTAIAALLDATKSQRVVTEAQANTMNSQERQALVLAAFQSKEELASLGDVLAEQIQLTANRDGFARRFLQYQDLAQGQLPQVRMSRKDIVASVATGPTEVATQFVRDNILFPQEFTISTRPFIEQKEIARASGDILEEKYTEALEGIMVAEDRIWKQMADQVVGGAGNPHLNVAGEFNPKAFARSTGYLQDYGVTPAFALLASDLWSDIIASPEWAEIIDPVSQHELLLTGKLGTVHGMEILSDQFRHEQHKVLNRGEFYIVSTPYQHGQYTDRGGVQSQPIDGTHESTAGRGWFMSELMSMVIANPYSVARGRRTL